MGEVEIVAEAVQTAEQTEQPITDLAARIIASWWHGGQASALYALTSSGAIDLESVEGEIEADLSAPYPGDEEATNNQRDLNALLAYVKAKGQRGPQDGWSNLRY